MPSRRRATAASTSEDNLQASLQRECISFCKWHRVGYHVDHETWMGRGSEALTMSGLPVGILGAGLRYESELWTVRVAASSASCPGHDVVHS
jgi:hypothetical protein